MSGPVRSYELWTSMQHATCILICITIMIHLWHRQRTNGCWVLAQYRRNWMLQIPVQRAELRLRWGCFAQTCYTDSNRLNLTAPISGEVRQGRKNRESSQSHVGHSSSSTVAQPGSLPSFIHTVLIFQWWIISGQWWYDMMMMIMNL